MMTAVLKKLLEIQQALKAPKNQWNDYGKYNYRSAEDILEGVKPLLKEHNATLTLSDGMEQVGDRIYTTATATFWDVETGESISVQASAREPLVHKKMDDSQLTGTASSYARKYAMNGLFAIDDTKDADATNTPESGDGNVRGKPVPMPKKPEAKKSKSDDEKEELISQIAMLCNELNRSPEWLNASVKKRFRKDNLQDLTNDQLKTIVDGLKKQKSEGA